MWGTAKLIDICERITQGPNPKYDGDLRDDLRVLKTKHLYDNVIHYEEADKLSYEAFQKCLNAKLFDGDVLLAIVGQGSINKCNVFQNSSENQFIFTRALGLLRPKKDVLDSFYLKFFLQSDQGKGYVDSGIGGTSGQQVVTTTHLKNIEIPLPALTEQKRIVAILDKAFAAIDEAKAKTEQNLKNARELFDSYLQQLSGEKKSLGEFVNIKTGKLNSNAAVEGGEYPFFTCSRDIFAINQFSFDCEAILLAGNNASGDFNVKHYKGKFDAYQRTYVITINDDTTLLYPFLYYQMIKSLKELKESSVGAGTKFLKLGMIKNLKISIPPIKTQREIVGTLLALKEDVDKLENIYKIKIESLNELKKSLLQKAFSGKLTTNQAEEAVA